MWSYGAIASAIAVGFTASLVAGRNGPGAAVLVQHASTIQQVGDGAVVSMRGSVAYPAYADYVLTVLSPDSGLTLRRDPSAEQWADSDGRPVRLGTFGRGHREELELETWAAPAPFSVSTLGDTVRVSNVSEAVLANCRFPDGFTPRDAGVLSPGGTVEAKAPSSADTPFFSCTSTSSPITLSESTYPVRVEGTSVVSVLLPLAGRSEDLQ